MRLHFTDTYTRYSGYFAVILAAICFATKSLFIKMAYLEGIDFITLLALRMVFSLPFFVMGFLFFQCKKKSLAIVFSFRGLQVVGLGLLGYYISSVMNFGGLLFIGAAMERLILFVYPTLVVVFGYFFYRKSIKPNTWFVLGITYLGIAIAVGGQLHMYGQQIWPGVWLIFGSAITFALYLVWSEQVLKVLHPGFFTSMVMLVSTVAVLIHFSFLYGIQKLAEQSHTAYAFGLAVGIISTVLPSYLMTWGMQQIGAEATGIMSTLGPVWTMWLAYIILGEQIDIYQIIGTIFVLTGVYLTTQYKS